MRARDLIHHTGHAHVAEPRAPCTLLWFRLDGPNLAALDEKLFGDGAPRVMIVERAIDDCQKLADEVLKTQIKGRVRGVPS